MKARTTKRPSPKTRTTATSAVDATDTPPQYESAVSQAELDQIIRAAKLGLRPPVRLKGPLAPELGRVLDVLGFLLTVFEHCDDDVTVQEMAGGLVEVLYHFKSDLEDLVNVARQRDELHGYSAPETGGVP
jgi:hypothetical protein